MILFLILCGLIALGCVFKLLADLERISNVELELKYVGIGILMILLTMFLVAHDILEELDRTTYGLDKQQTHSILWNPNENIWEVISKENE